MSLTSKVAIAGMAFAVLALTGSAWSAETPVVTIDNFSFKPSAIAVKVGAHVLFVNHDDLPHSVVIPDLKQKSGLLDTDDHYEAVFDKPGHYAFFCGIHPIMTGEVNVSAE